MFRESVHSIFEVLNVYDDIHFKINRRHIATVQFKTEAILWHPHHTILQNVVIKYFEIAFLAGTAYILKFEYFQIFINNEWVDAEDGQTFDDVNPSTEKIIARVAQGRKVSPCDLAHCRWRVRVQFILFRSTSTSCFVAQIYKFLFSTFWRFKMLRVSKKLKHSSSRFGRWAKKPQTRVKFRNKALTDDGLPLTADATCQSLSKIKKVTGNLILRASNCLRSDWAVRLQKCQPFLWPITNDLANGNQTSNALSKCDARAVHNKAVLNVWLSGYNLTFRMQCIPHAW